MTPKGIVYLCGPISSNLEGYRYDFHLAERLVREAGYEAISTAHLPLGLKESDYMRIAVATLEAADVVVALKGWTNSTGAQIEWAYAKRTGKRTMTLGQFCQENNVLDAATDEAGRETP